MYEEKKPEIDLCFERMVKFTFNEAVNIAKSELDPNSDVETMLKQAIDNLDHRCDWLDEKESADRLGIIIDSYKPLYDVPVFPGTYQRGNGELLILQRDLREWIIDVQRKQRLKAAVNALKKVKPSPYWKERAIEIANIYKKDMATQGKEVTKKDISLHVEKKLDLEGLKGKRGQKLTALYIERHALKGITGNLPGHKYEK